MYLYFSSGVKSLFTISLYALSGSNNINLAPVFTFNVFSATSFAISNCFISSAEPDVVFKSSIRPLISVILSKMFLVPSASSFISTTFLMLSFEVLSVLLNDAPIIWSVNPFAPRATPSNPDAIISLDCILFHSASLMPSGRSNVPAVYPANPPEFNARFTVADTFSFLTKDDIFPAPNPIKSNTIPVSTPSPNADADSFILFIVGVFLVDNSLYFDAAP